MQHPTITSSSHIQSSGLQIKSYGRWAAQSFEPSRLRKPAPAGTGTHKHQCKLSSAFGLAATRRMHLALSNGQVESQITPKAHSQWSYNPWPSVTTLQEHNTHMAATAESGKTLSPKTGKSMAT